MKGAVPQWLVVARREFIERVRTRWFVVVTLLGPLLMLGVLIVPMLLAVESANEGTRIHVQDRGESQLGAALAAGSDVVANFEVTVVANDIDEGELKRRVRASEIDGYLLLPENLLDGGKATYRGDNAASPIFERAIQTFLDFGVRAVRAQEAGMTEAQIARLQMPVELDIKQTTGTGEGSSGTASFIVGYAVMFILYFSILLYAVNVMRSVVLEKTSRVVEILISAVKPRALMMGKIVGVAGAGVFQLSVWLIMAAVIIRYREQVLGLFGLPGAGAFDVPPLSAVDVVVALCYFLLGLFFYASLYAAIGAMVNSDQEAQQLQTPVIVLLIIPAACVQIVAGDPRGGISEALTLVPFSSPVLMPMRWMLGGASLFDLALSVFILALSTAGAVWLAARIYRVGILMYGKRPSLRELIRWIRR